MSTPDEATQAHHRAATGSVAPMPAAPLSSPVRAATHDLPTPPPKGTIMPKPNLTDVDPNAEVFHLKQSSLQFSDNGQQAREDLADDFQDEPDAILFTEAQPNEVLPWVRQAARRAGYFLYINGSGSPIAIHPKHKVLLSGYDHVVDATGPGVVGRHGNRGVAWVMVRTEGGNKVTPHEQHWVTKYRLDKAGAVGPRENDHLDQTLQMIDSVKAHAKGSGISLWAGDTNISEQADTGFDPDSLHARFTKAGLVSVWDELNRYPGTHGSRTIDVLGFYSADRRVSLIDTKVHPRRNSDHRAVSAWFAIAPKKANR